MYLRYYHLREAPFGITPDPAFLYLSPSHKEALASVLYGIEKRKGFVSITGEVGSGKTTILKAVLARIDPDRVKVVYLFNPDLSFAELVRAIMEELGLDLPACDVPHAVRQLHRYLIDIYRQNKHVVLIIDEVQRMPVDTLEQLRMLSNLETTKDKLIQIVLSGQPEFETALLTQHALRQLRQRIAVRARIQLLTPGQSVAYVEHRLGRVSYGKTPVFTSRALRRIARCTRGNPRAINIVCDNALIAGYADQERPVTVKTVRRAAAGLGWGGNRAFVKWGAVAAAVVLVAAGARAVFGRDDENVSEATAESTIAAPQRAATLTPTTPVEEPPPERPQAIEPEPPYDVADAAEAKLMALLPLASYPFGGATDALERIWDLPSVTPTGVRLGENAPANPSISSLQREDTSHAPERAPAAETVGALSNKAGTTDVERTGLPITRTVKPGDNLGRLSMEMYGSTDRDLIERILQHNPHIRDANTIFVGDIIVFPEADGTTCLNE